jgi:phosphoglycolate phosphatase
VSGRRLILWCLDGVLIPDSSFNTDNLRYVCGAIAGRRCEELVAASGRTMPGIVRDTLRNYGFAGNELDKLVVDACALLAARTRERRAELIKGDRVPGATEVLLALRMRGEAHQSLVAGDVEEVAFARANAFEFDRYLDAMDLGGYGADSDDLGDLVEASLSKFLAKYGEEPTTTLIGWTAADVAAGVNAGVNVVAVAGRPGRAASLRAAGADQILPDLTDTQAVLAAIEAASGL